MKKVWTDAERARYRRMALVRQAWKLSTGPTTPEGKRKAAQNSRVHGARSRDVALLRAYCASVSTLIDRV